MARILVVDDSRSARKALAELCAALGHEVVGLAADGVQALAEYERLRPDLVTMDLLLGDEDGREVTAGLLKVFPEARIVVVSALQERQAVLAALEQGARHFLIKPVGAAQLEKVLSRVLSEETDLQRRRERLADLRQGPARAARVLVVDDSAVARKGLREMITSLGYAVAGEAANGAQAFVEYTRCQPDLVTMDLTMQGLGGAEVTSKIMAAYPQARIVVISAMEAREAIVDALERGARHFLLKPVRRETVAAVFSCVLGQEFDLARHTERVRKLKEAGGPSSALLESAVQRSAPPYAICAQDGLVHVMLSQNLSATSCRPLLQELAEHLQGSPRVLLDFGAVRTLAAPVLQRLDELVAAVENSGGMVRAVTQVQQFADAVAASPQAQLLAGVLRVR